MIITPCYSNLQNLQLASKSNAQQKLKVWNINKVVGWEKYKNDDEVEFDKVTENEVSSTELIRRFEVVHNKMKYQAFGKVSTSSGGSQNKVLASLYSK